MRYTKSNKAVASFTLAVNRRFKSENGERETDFINCILWGQQAENLANWCKKGALIGIAGRIQTRNYENQQGQRIYVTEVIAESFQVLESKNSVNADDYVHNNRPDFSRQQKNNSFNSNPIEISDDDLPF